MLRRLRDSFVPESSQRVEPVDAMRPFAQAAVITTHAAIFFAPLGANMAVTSLLVVTRFSRESFFVISAFALTYAYGRRDTWSLREFWARRLLLTGVPYVLWTIIYYVFTTSTPEPGFPYYRASAHYLVSTAGLHHFFNLLWTGYYQLYFIVVLFQFYVVFPWLLRALRRARRWHVVIVLGSFVWQVFYDEAFIHCQLWGIHLEGRLQSRVLISYPVYLLVGMIVALRYEDVAAWARRHASTVLVYGVVTALLAVGLNYWHQRIINYVAASSDAFAPLAVLYNLGAIASLYLLGVWLCDRRRPGVLRRGVFSTSRASYGVYLSQMLWIPLLVRIGARAHFNEHVAWEIRVILVVVAVFGAGYLLTVLLERTWLGPALVGRTRPAAVSRERGRATSRRR